MSRRWCKIVTVAIILATLTAAVAAIVSSGAERCRSGTSSLPGWAASLGAAALKAFGYRLFTPLMALGGALIHILADVIAWLLRKICQLLGSCQEEDCKTPSLNPSP